MVEAYPIPNWTKISSNWLDHHLFTRPPLACKSIEFIKLRIDIASTIGDDLSTLNSDQFDDLSIPTHDREAAQDLELESIDSSTPGSRKRGREV